jgi:hypothetical protein
MRKGSCLCGGVAFELHGPLRPVLACHCHQCRKTSGHYWACTSVPKHKLVLTNQETLSWYTSSPSAQRGFCHRCGASLFWQWHDSEAISVAAGSLDDDSACEFDQHIFSATKGDYYTIPSNETVRPPEQDIDASN